MDSSQLEVLQPDSERGDFYVEGGCCLSCGVPQAVAPNLVGWTDERYAQCYWKKQPETPEELERAFAVFDGQEVGCHRYSGNNAEIQTRIGMENCGHPLTEPSRTDTSAWNAAPLFDLKLDAGLFERIWAKIRRRE